MNFTVAENIVLKRYYKKPYSNGGFLNYKVIISEADRLIHEFDVRPPDYKLFAKNLSGGNQQKVILAREFSSSPDLLIAVQPTRGMDVGAIEYIHRKLIELRDSGKAILLVSLELDEILNLSDRIAVMYSGRIMDILESKNANKRRDRTYDDRQEKEGGLNGDDKKDFAEYFNAAYCYFYIHGCRWDSNINHSKAKSYLCVHCSF